MSLCSVTTLSRSRIVTALFFSLSLLTIIGAAFIRTADVKAAAPSALVSLPAPPPPALSESVTYDFDGDGKADVGRWKAPITEFAIKNSSSGLNTLYSLGSSSGKMAPGDFNGDGKTDPGVFDSGTWTFKPSTNPNAAPQTISLGAAGDVPSVGDFDGDGTTDAAVFRPSNGYWYFKESSTGNTVSTFMSTDSPVPVAGDYDWDGKTDRALYLTGAKKFHIFKSSNGGTRTIPFGQSTDVPLTGDFDGDGLADLVLFRPTTSVWYLLKSSNNYSTQNVTNVTWGSPGDQPVPADYDGDNITDYAVWRPSTGVWHIKKSSNSTYTYETLGQPTDSSVPSSYIKQVGFQVDPVLMAHVRLRPRNKTGSTDFLSQNFSWGTSLVSLAGRAGMDLNIPLGYNSLIWAKPSSSTIAYDPDTSNLAPGFRFGFPVIEAGYYRINGGFAYMMVTPEGQRVEFSCPDAGNTYYATDSSYMKLVTNGAANPDDPVENITISIFAKDGTQYSYEWKAGAFRCTRIRDRNGNIITITNSDSGLLTKVVDTLGREVNFNYDPTTFLLTSITQNWKTDNGTNQTVSYNWARFEYVNKTVATNFSVGVIGPTNGTVIKVLDKVTFADDSSTRFTYNGYLQVQRVAKYAKDGHLLQYVSTNLDSISGTRSDCPKFTLTRSMAENFNGGAPVTVSNDAPTAFTGTVPDGITSPTDRVRITINSHPTPGFYTNLYFHALPANVGETYGLEGLLLATEDCVSDCIGTNRLRWTSNRWMTDAPTGWAWPINPRITESRVGDGANIKGTLITYPTPPTPTGLIIVGDYKDGLPSKVETYDTISTNVRTRTNYTYFNSPVYENRNILGLVSSVTGSGWNSQNQSLEPTSYTVYGYDEEPFTIESNQNIPSVINHDPAFSSGFVGGRGNLSSIRRYDVFSYASNTEQRIRYDIAGSPVAQIDPLGRKTSIGYSDSFNDGGNSRNTYAYATTITDPAGTLGDINHSTFVKYRFDMGINVEATSPAPLGQFNGRTSKRVYDQYGRLERDSVYAASAEKAYTRYVYGINGVQVQKYSTLVDANNSTTADLPDEVLSEDWFDGAGRVRWSRTANPSSIGGSTATRTEYDILGRVKKRSVPTEVSTSNQLNPDTWLPAGDDNRGFDIFGSPIWLWNAFEYDWKGRPTKTIPTDSTGTDGKETLISYTGCGCAGGQETTVQGPADPTIGNARRKSKSYTDILGREIKVEKYSWAGAVLNSSRTYYSGRDQVVAIREYPGPETGNTLPYQETAITYDGYGRKKTQHNPIDDASAVTTWNYNSDDSVSRIIDPRGAMIDYSYNSRGLPTFVSYTPPVSTPSYTSVPDTPDVLFEYDNVGNRTKMTDGSGITNYSYDSLSNLISESKEFSGLSGSFALTYSYHLSGKLKTITDPFGAIVNYTDDLAGRTTSVTGSNFLNAANYATNIKYRAFGAVKELTYGSADNSHVSYGFDDRQRITTYESTSSTVPGGYVRKASYEYFRDDRTKKVTNALDSGYSQDYTYDDLGRLSTSTSGTKVNSLNQQVTLYSQSLGYDGYDNLTARNTEVWGAKGGFTASYSNGRKLGSNELFDASGNIVDKTSSATVYDRWKFDASGRNTESITRWFQPIPSPQMDRTETITKTFDGDGQNTKRQDDTVITQFPANTTFTTSKVEYYLHSTVLGGKVVTEIDGTGGKKQTNVIVGGGVLAEQHYNATNNTGEVYWRHDDLVSGSFTKVDRSGTPGNIFDPPSKAEYEPMGGAIPTIDPTTDPSYGIPAAARGFKYTGDVNRPEYGCRWDGTPISCDKITGILRSHGGGIMFVDIRAEGGFGLLTTLQANFQRRDVYKDLLGNDSTPDKADGTIQVSQPSEFQYGYFDLLNIVRGPSAIESPLPVQTSCEAALKQAGKTPEGLQRAQNDLQSLMNIVKDVNFARLLAAVGIQESDYLNINQGRGGPGRGVFQIEPKTYGISEAQANSVSSAADAIAKTWGQYYSSTLTALGGAGYNLADSSVRYHALAGVARIHNRGSGGVVSSDKNGEVKVGSLLSSALKAGDMTKLDNKGLLVDKNLRDTAHGTYVRNVMDLFFYCFGG